MKIIRQNSLQRNYFFNESFLFRSPKNSSYCSCSISSIQEKIDVAFQIIQGKKLYHSNYNVCKTFTDHTTVIFNTLYDSVVILDEEESRTFEVLEQTKSSGYLEAVLYMLGILEITPEFEKMLVKIQQNELFFNTKGLPSVTILPTQACNARCAYCFAEHNPKIEMSDQTRSNVVRYFRNSFHPADKVILRWFGGEPLLDEKSIDYIVDGINDVFQGQLKYKSILFTNGSLLTDALIYKAKKKWHLWKIQLTIDGYGEEHFNRKKFIVPSINYYEKVIQDIEKLLAEEIAVDCRLNLDKDNISSLDQILTDLLPYKDSPLFRVRATVLRPSDCGDTQFNYITPSDFEWAYEYIYRKMFSYGFLKDITDILPRRRQEDCIRKSANKIIIGADGKLYKCLQKVLVCNHSVGDLQSGITGQNFAFEFAPLPIQRECKSCIYLPLCAGGCEAYRKLQGQINVSPCLREKYFFDLLLRWIHQWSLEGKIV